MTGAQAAVVPDDPAPDISVIVPFYDERAFLRTALTSIRAQPVAAEIIVVNDNPDSFAPDDLRRLGLPETATLVQHPRNLGLSAARNSGLDRATGRFVAFLDADDYFVLGGLAQQLDLARDSGADITHAQTYFTRPGEVTPRILPRDAALFGQRRTAAGLTCAEEAQFFTSSWSSLYRRDFLTAGKLRFDEAQPRFEDRLFVLHSVTRAARIAFLGRPTRVWRGRAGSISVSDVTPETRLLQVQLLEKCLAHIRAETAAGRLPPRFAKRELFNTVSRLIWDMDAVTAIADGADPDAAELGRRIAALLGSESFGQPIFGDRVLQRISRVGQRTRLGRVGRTAFFGIHKALRQGDFAAARAQIAACAGSPAAASPRSVPRPACRRLVLHLGLHKTGTTYIQHHLIGHREVLRQAGILIPETGFEPPDPGLRGGATPGHQGLVAALRASNPAPWQALRREIAASGADTVLLSCENMLFPTRPDRAALFAALAERLGGIPEIVPLALVRRADTRIEAFYRERVAGGHRSGTGGLAAFLVDNLAPLADFPALFGPLEQALGVQVRLGDFDAMRGPGLWPGFAALAGLPPDLPVLDCPAYRGPDRDEVRILEVLNAMIAQPARREALLRGWFALHPPGRGDVSLLSPAERLEMLDLWTALSAGFAARRGYAPDPGPARAALSAEDWQPPGPLPASLLEDLVDIAAQLPETASPPAPRPAARGAPRDTVLRVRLRPWAARLWRKLRDRRA